MMAAVRSKDTQPEVVVRRLLHKNGYRYRIHRSDLPGKPDIVLSSKRKIIFVHGCFWHQHEGCDFSHVPKSNRGYWAPKLKANRSRDRKHIKALRAGGWECLVVWECELSKPNRLDRLLSRFLGPGFAPRTSTQTEASRRQLNRRLRRISARSARRRTLRSSVRG